MYEIHINDSKIYLTKSAFVDSIAPDNCTLIAKYNGKAKTLLNYIDKAEKSKDAIKIVLHNPQVNILKNHFFSLFKIIKAAGGIVLNEKGELLMIFRKGLWDLPKGKMEKGEKRKQTAIREVMEETGIRDVNILSSLPNTYHTYKIGGQRVMKQSFWFVMETLHQTLKPQTEEDIEKAEWVSISDMRSGKYNPIYRSIDSLIQYFIKGIDNISHKV